MNAQEIGTMIQRLREQQNLTQKALAERLAVSDKTISKWETGRGLPDMSLFQPLAEAEGKRLEAHIPPAVELRGVQENMFRLFSILLDNAVKYCDPGGTIRLSLGQRGRNIYLSVSNPCAGADTAQLPRWFDRFYRSDSSRARATGGYGIGLSTARAIVSRHRGRITNRCENGQVTFSVVIPQFPKVRKIAVHR